MLRIATALLLTLTTLTACSDDAPTGPTSLDITVAGMSITPNAERIEVGVGETFTLNVDSDREGGIHVHSTPEQSLDFAAGETALEIVVDKPGSVEIEEHESGIVIVTLLVQ
jgi:hypothetical protein